MHARLSCLSIILCLCAIDTLAAESATTTLGTVTVTGDTETDAALTLPSLDGARERIALTPGGAGVVDAEDYKNGRASTLQDALGYATGVFVQPRFGAEEARLSIRGSGIQRTFHLRGLKLLQDGVPLNQADGGGDFQSVEPLATRYIEVFRGANALSYGSTTLGGAINFVSPSGYDAPPASLRFEGGSFGYLRAQAALAGVVGKNDYYLSLSHLSQDGFRDHAEQDNQRIFANVGHRFSDNLETRLYFAAVKTDSQLPGSLTKEELENQPRKSINTIGRNQKRDFDLLRLSSKTVYQLAEQRFEASFFYSRKDLFHPIFRVLDIVSDDYGADFRYVSEQPLFGRKNLLTVGFSPVRGTAEDDRFVNRDLRPIDPNNPDDALGTGSIRGPRAAESLQTSVNLDLYAENQWYVRPDTALVTGAQWTRATRELEDAFLVNEDNTPNADNSLNETYTAFSPKLGVRYEFNPATQLFANISRSFEPPSFGELSGGPNITPVTAQRATTFELGSRGRQGKLQWDVAYYYAAIKDELLSLSGPRGLPLGTRNADKTIHQGIELGLDIAILKQLQLRQTYLWNDFRFDNDQVFGDNPLAGVPEHFYRAELLYRTPGGYYFGPNVEWSPKRYAVDHANTVFADGYALAGFKAGFSSKKGLSWFIDARNLADEKYAATTGVINQAGLIDGKLDARQFLPGDGRSVFAGVEWKF